MKSKNAQAATPLMEQYLKIKAQHQDTILLYRMGDFYETFYEDAQLIAKILGIALTKRAHGKSAEVPLAGFPYHALDNYLHKLVRAGHRVAICEQTEDPKQAKGVVKREVIEIVSPGATLSEKLLDHKANNFLAAIFVRDEVAGIALADVSTGEFFVSEFEKTVLEEQLLSFQPKEILLSENQFESFADRLHSRLNCVITKRDNWIFRPDYGRETLLGHFHTHSLKGFGLEDLDAGLVAAGAILNYFRENYRSSLEHIREVRVLNLSRFMMLDEATRINLEIQSAIRENIGGNTLTAVLDETCTAMGARLMRSWLNQPLRVAADINARLDLVAELVSSEKLLNDIRSILDSCSDLDRIMGKIATGRANGRDLLHLKSSLEVIPRLQPLIEQCGLPRLQENFSGFAELQPVTSLIEQAIVDEPPLTITDGGVIRKGYNPELDELLDISLNGKNWLATLQQKERARTGISTLKISYNKVFGYYLEVTKTNLDKVPEDYIRKQTLVNAERYITEELKEKEEKILGAEDKLKSMEYEIFQQIRSRITSHIHEIQQNSQLLARLDCLSGLARASIDNKYVRPQVDDGRELYIKNGRHPVVEKFMKPGEEFVSNDVELHPDEEQIWIITGPNMAGKSTFLRQVGLIAFMAQIGCFVPADEARIGAVDRIFTRVGASDNLASGESTFLVEMNETAHILNNASDRSLVLLDEIGRGTSTFDGLSIAWSVAEYLHQENRLRAKTLFATHYHELTELAQMFPRIRNYNIAVEEWEDQIIFLRKIVAGGTDNSYGIHVAQMAGLPPAVIERAREILVNLEANELTPGRVPKLARRRSGRAVDQNQTSLFPLAVTPSPVEEELKKLDVNRLTPVDALVKLNELKKMADK